ncbi:flagellar protein FlgN [Massilia sp. Dwa41.01b]|uniref:flagellar export chaperone FlgN n=1 Tax=Massilia sp. Dwa41.01b TaxID=2709302 RepID=UPI00160383A7|nr:flagellar export chaperone FlgN [Massilia sp. Dwa41.01b]QNA88203.1 flagellar protein FlgN [Massilia sp. Dwa41.01b]
MTAATPAAPRLTRQGAVAALVAGVAQDLHAAAEIHALLERQFQAALRHRGAELAQLAEELTPALDAMDARRRQRVALVRALHGPDATMATFIATQPEPGRATLAANWGELERLVVACKGATTRNGNLLAEQFTTMQRVLHGGDGTYAPR